MDPEARFVVTATDTTSRAFASADRNLKSFTRSAMQLRSTLAGFGIVLSGRALANWMARAIETTDAVGEQRIAVEQAREAFASFSRMSDQLAESFAVRLTPAISAVAAGLDNLRQTFDPTELEAYNQRIEQTKQELQGLQNTLRAQQGERNSVDWLERLFGMDEAEWDRRIAKTQQQIAQLQENLRIFDAGQFRMPLADITETETKALEALITDLNLPKNIASMEEWIRLEENIYALREQATPFITQEERIALEEFIYELNTIPERLTQEEWIDLESFIYDLNNMEQEALFSAQEIGANFKSAFDGWLIDGERGFKDFLRRLTISMTTSALFKGISSLFPGGSFFSNFFGGFRADGGPVSAGKGYIVGERGPEMFFPGQSGMVAANGGGATITLYQTNTFHGGDMRQQEAAIARNNAKLKQEIKAEIAHDRNRGR